jgi:transcriptional regulator with XRE-family HTH domain
MSSHTLLPGPDSAFTIASGRTGFAVVRVKEKMPRRKKEDSSFGPRLSAIRKARGLTQVQLAQATGSTQRAISYYENDDGIPPASAVIALAKALKVSTDELLGLKPPKIERANDTAEARRLWKRFQMMAELPEKDQRAVIRLINSLVSLSSRPLRKAG